MDEISTQLRAAVSAAPPTRIDLDRLIRAERQRRRQVTWVWSGTGLAATVAAVAVAPALVAGGPSSGPVVRPAPASSSTAAVASPGTKLCAGVTPKPSGPLPPLQSYGTVRTRPTEEPKAGVLRLTGALREALRTRLPDGVRVEPAQRGCTEPQFQYHPSYREYTVDATVRRGDGSGFFLLRVGPTGKDVAIPDCEQALNSSDCRMTTYPDGSTALLSKSVEAPGARQLWVLVVRPDGTSVLAITNNFRTEVVANQPRITATAEEPLLTLDQLVTLARSPGLTVYP